jgi:hypothetical protein
MGDRHRGGGGGFAEAPGSVITIEGCDIFRRYYEKFRGNNNTVPKIFILKYGGSVDIFNLMKRSTVLVKRF